MDMYEFGKVCQPLNKKYNELFGYIPHYFLPGLSREVVEISE